MTDILELIDNAIDDYTSADAMRWTPDPVAVDTRVFLAEHVQGAFTPRVRACSAGILQRAAAWFIDDETMTVICVNGTWHLDVARHR